MFLVLQLQLALCCAWIGSRLLARTMARPRARLWADRGLLLLALAAPLLVQALPRPWTPPAALRTASATGAPTAQLHLESVGLAPEAVDISLAPVATAVELGDWLPLVLVAAGLLRLALALGRLARTVARGTPAGRFEGVPVIVLREATGPFAALLPTGRAIVIDPATAASPGRGLALRHERQHHAQGDPLFAWLWLGLRGALGWNPLVGRWAREAGALEEQACDAAVVARPEVSPKAYGRMLLAHARRAPAPVGARGLAPRSPLHERLLALARPRPARPLRAVLGVGLSLALLAAGALGARSLAADLRIDDNALSEAISANTIAPSHPRVQAALRRMLTDQAGFYRRSLARRHAWAPLVDGALDQAGLPAFLAAVPLVESGYTNWGAPGSPTAESAAPGTIPGRGLWMFIPSTARDYGLAVGPDRDQRLEPVSETAAAVALLTDLHEEHGDWALALAAYNEGSDAVHAAVAAGGSRDALVLAEAGLLNDYVPTVLAAAVLLENPELQR
jgi:hypothetical protein